MLNNSANIEFLSNHTILSSFTFTKGNALVDDKIFIPGTATISSYSASKYFAGTGYLKRTLLPSTAYVFPVGNSANYLPASLTTAAGFVSDTIWIRVESTKFSASYNGSFAAVGLPITSHVVEPVWRIAESTGTGSTFTTLTLQWNGSNEKYLFTRSACGIVTNGGGAWNAPSAAAASGANPYTRSLGSATIPAGT